MPPLLLTFGLAFVAIPADLGIQGKTAKTAMQALREFDIKGSVLLTVSTTLFILGLVRGRKRSESPFNAHMYTNLALLKNLGGNVLPCKSLPTCFHHSTFC